MSQNIKQHGWIVAYGLLALIIFSASSWFVVNNREATAEAQLQADALHSLDRFHRLIHEWHVASEKVGWDESLAYYYPAFRSQRGALKANPITGGAIDEVDRHVQRALMEQESLIGSIFGSPLQEAAEDVRLASVNLREARSARLVAIQADWALSIRLLWLSFAMLVALLPIHLIRKNRTSLAPMPDPHPALNKRMAQLDRQPIVDALSDHADVGLVVLDAKGIIQEANHAVCELLGFEVDELIGRKLSTLIQPVSTSDGLPSIAQEIRNKNGELLRAQVSLTHIRDARGETAHTFAIIEDVTAREVAQALNDTLRREAEAAKQIRTSIVANMNHELRTPLSVILGFSAILREEVGGSHSEFVEAIEKSGRQLLDVVQNLLDFSGVDEEIEERKVQELMDPRKLVSEALGPYHVHASEKGVKMSFHTPIAPMQVVGDPRRLQRIVGLLVDNAVKFTEQGYITVALASKDEHVELQIRDTGIGMDAAHVDSVFEAFHQASQGESRTYGGTGLGLTVARQLVEAMHGTISLVSTPNKGTTVTATFPKAQVEASSNEVRRAA